MITIQMKLDKDTKNKYVYKAIDPTAKLETIYVLKSAFDKAPENITVVIEPI